MLVLFGSENDCVHYYLMKVWGANANFDFVFRITLRARIQSDGIFTIKAYLAKEIKEVICTLRIIRAEVNKVHRDWDEICYGAGRASRTFAASRAAINWSA